MVYAGESIYAFIAKFFNNFVLYIEQLEEMLYKEYGYNAFDTGGYTGRWGSKEGRMAMLHQKEIVLNQIS